jgi:hypothetical protein
MFESVHDSNESGALSLSHRQVSGIFHRLVLFLVIEVDSQRALLVAI